MMILVGSFICLVFLTHRIAGDACPSGSDPVVHACVGESAEGSVMSLDTSGSVGLDGSCTCSLKTSGGPVEVTLTAQVVSSACVIIDIVDFDFLYTCKRPMPGPRNGTLSSGKDHFISLLRNDTDIVADFCLRFERTGTDGQFQLECLERGVDDVIDKAPYLPTVAPEQDTTVSGQDTTVSGQDTTVSGQETTSSGQDTTISGQDTTVSGQETTSSGQDTVVLGQDTTVSEQDTTVSEQDITVSEQDTTVSGQETTVSGHDTTVLGQDTTSSGQDTSGQDSTASEQDTTVSEQDTTVSEQDTTVSEQDTTVSEQDTAASEQDTTASEQDTTASEQDTSTPGQGTDAQEQTSEGEGAGKLPTPARQARADVTSIPTSYIVLGVFAGIFLLLVLLGTIWYIKDKLCRRRKTAPITPPVESVRL